MYLYLYVYLYIRYSILYVYILFIREALRKAFRKAFRKHPYPSARTSHRQGTSLLPVRRMLRYGAVL